MHRASEAQIRAVVAANLRDGDSRRAIEIAAEPIWRGNDEIRGTDTTTFRIRACRSPLEVRDALQSQREDGEFLVILTSCKAVDLGLDVRARLVKGDIVSLDPYSAALALFRAKVLDPQLANERWL